MSPTPENTAPARKRSPWRWLLVLVVAAAGVGGWALNGGLETLQANDGDADAPIVIAQPQAMRLHPTETYTVGLRDLSATVAFTGTVQPTQRANISAEVGGIAQVVRVQSGDAVRAGDVLIEIDATDLELQLRQQQGTLNSTQIQLDSAIQTLDRTQSLADRGLSPQSALDAAVAEVDRLRASLQTVQSQVEQVEANLARTVIRAPFDGIVSSRAIEPGQVVGQGTTLISLVDLSRVSIDAMVPLAASGDITVGQTATLQVQGVGNTRFEAVVDRINPTAEEGTRSILVHLSLDNPDTRLRGGMFVTGTIVTAQSNDTIAVPDRAVIDADTSPYVFAIADGELVRRDIEVAAVWERLDTVEIATGVAEGDVIVALPLSGLQIGQQVVVGER